MGRRNVKVAPIVCRRQNHQLCGEQLLPLSAKLVLIVKYTDCCCCSLLKNAPTDQRNQMSACMGRRNVKSCSHCLPKTKSSTLWRAVAPIVCQTGAYCYIHRLLLLQLTIKCADRPTKPNVGLYGSPKCEKLLPFSAEMLLNVKYTDFVVASGYKMGRQTDKTIRRPAWVAEM